MPKTIKLKGIVGLEIKAELLKNKIDKRDKNIIYVDSEGGSVFEGNRLYNLLKDQIAAGVDIEIVLGVLAASAASYFPLGVGKDRIKARANTVFMGHKAWALNIGNADKMRSKADILDGMDIMMAKAYSSANGKSVDENITAMGEEFWLMGGQSVVDAGFASGITEGDSEEETDDDTAALEKSEVKAKIEEAKAILRMEPEEEDLSKWAACIEADNKTASAPKTSGGNIEQEGKCMTLSEFLTGNPEAKAEYDGLIEAAKTEGATNAADENARIMGIIEAANVKLSDSLKATLSDTSLDVKDYALAVLKSNNAQPASNADKLKGIGAATETKDTVTEDAKAEEQKEIDAIADQAVALEEKRRGNK